MTKKKSQTNNHDISFLSTSSNFFLKVTVSQMYCMVNYGTTKCHCHYGSNDSWGEITAIKTCRLIACQCTDN